MPEMNLKVRDYWAADPEGYEPGFYLVIEVSEDGENWQEIDRVKMYPVEDKS